MSGRFDLTFGVNCRPFLLNFNNSDSSMFGLNDEWKGAAVWKLMIITQV